MDKTQMGSNNSVLSLNLMFVIILLSLGELVPIVDGRYVIMR